MALQGKGFWIWKIPNCEGGDPAAIANMAQASNLSHVFIKIADENRNYNVNTTTGVDLIPPVAAALRAKGFQVWGWHYVYGDDPQGEAQTAIQRTTQLGLDGYIIDAEVEYMAAGKHAAATTFMNQLRSGLPTLPIALSSFRFPSYQGTFPWAEFLEKCDFNFPQVYWEQAHNAGSQLTSSVHEFQALVPFRPIIPVGPTYKNGGWAPTVSDITDFLNTARSLNLPAANFFSWDECRRDLNPLWNTIRDYSWTVAPPTQTMPQKLIAALNTHDATQVATLYAEAAVHINAATTIQGNVNIKSWFQNLLAAVLPAATFTLTGTTGSSNSFHFTWTATSSLGSVTDGSDTIGIYNDKISYHYSFFTSPGH
jgi:hypothetical protein